MRRHILIIGNGIAGVTAARFIRKRGGGERITIVSDETDHHYARTALMYIYMGHLRYRDTKPYEDAFWSKNGIELVRGRVEAVEDGFQRVRLQGGGTLGYDVLLIASGSASNTFGWPGQDLQGVQGLYGMPDLRSMEQATRGVRRAVVVGGGLIGVEMAEMLHSRHTQVTFLVREQGYMDYVLPEAEAASVADEIRDHGIDLRLGVELSEILPDEHGRVRAVRTSRGEELTCGFVGLTVGVHPNIGFLEGSGIETNRGVLVDAYFRTNVPEVYALGDCAEFREEAVGHRPVEQLWYTGRLHGKTVARTVCGVPTRYERGVFFNSAKFFSLEYQTYGDVPPTPREGVGTLFWRHPDGRRLIRLCYREEDGRILGFNLLGVRYRHAVCERWIREGRSIRYVLAHLAEANFDAEFFARFEEEVVHQFNRRHPDEPIPRSSGPSWFTRLRGQSRAASSTPAS